MGQPTAGNTNMPRDLRSHFGSSVLPSPSASSALPIVLFLACPAETASHGRLQKSQVLPPQLGGGGAVGAGRQLRLHLPRPRPHRVALAPRRPHPCALAERRAALLWGRRWRRQAPRGGGGGEKGRRVEAQPHRRCGRSCGCGLFRPLQADHFGGSEETCCCGGSSCQPQEGRGARQEGWCEGCRGEGSEGGEGGRDCQDEAGGEGDEEGREETGCCASASGCYWWTSSYGCGC
mmetsp:Transcript_171495/g.549683  ORF Transcript_171495/g.549683 Transcript_171495/m.549683 type:complete len:234 (+) Transcript_171495:25-726(+)